MKHTLQNQKNSVTVLVVLFSINLGVGVLHGSSVKPAETVSNNEIMRSLSPQLISADVTKVADAIATLPFAQQQQIVTAIIANSKSPLDRNQKLDLIFKVALKNPNESGRQAILSLIAEYAQLLEGKSPIIYCAVLNGNQNIVPDLLTVIKKNNDKEIITSLHYAVTANNPNALKELFNQGVMVPTKDINNLLWHAVARNKSADFVDILKAQQADVNTIKNGRTLLVKAVENNNLSLVQKLVKAGADVNRIANNAVGSALQVAVRKGLTDIDLYLRDKGARE